MNKIVKWVLIAVVVIGVVLFALYRYNLSQTKKYSPEDTVEFVQGDLEIEIFYNRPYKKGREIFGGLVPYGVVWRTGANEATTFKTNQALSISGQELPAGKYTLWTIPGEKAWDIIFNSKMYAWGVNNKGVASRKPEYDVLKVTAPVIRVPSVVEQFTISIRKPGQPALVFEWDQTQVALPMQ